MPSPGAPWRFSRIINDVLMKVENRTADTALGYGWIRDAVLEIASNPEYRDDFVELEVTGPLYNLSVGVAEYDDRLLLPATDYSTATLDIRLWTDYPTNSRFVKLRYTSFQRADESSVGNSQPSRWYRFGQNVCMYPPPDMTYQVQSRALRQHPINFDDLANTEILLPVDWIEIIKLAAAERGFIDMEEYEKANAIHVLIYGDPENPSRPGLVNARTKKRANENWREQQQLRPMVRRYSYGGL